MHTTIQTAYFDTRASDLSWVLGREPLPALARLGVHLGDARVELRILGASHQVLVDWAGATCSETVACLPGGNAPLPLGASEQLGDLDYSLSVRVESMSPGSFSGRAQELLELVAEHPQGLAATFPGAPDAFTALLANRCGDQLHWRTWHAYPQECRIVGTRTRVTLRHATEPRQSPAGGVPVNSGLTTASHA